MTEFARLKMGFVVAMLAALFMLKPLFDEFTTTGQGGIYYFSYLNQQITFISGYYLFAGFLGLAAYFFAMDLVGRRPNHYFQMLGNFAYAVAIMVPPIYFAMGLIGYIDYLIESYTGSAQSGHNVSLVLTVFALIFAIWSFLKLGQQLRMQDKDSTVDQLGAEQAKSMAKANGLLEAGLYDLVLVECFRAIETALKKRVIAENVFPKQDGFSDLLETGVRLKVIGPSERDKIHDLRVVRNEVVHENRDMSRDEAERVIDSTRAVILSMEKSGNRPSEEAA